MSKLKYKAIDITYTGNGNANQTHYKIIPKFIQSYFSSPNNKMTPILVNQLMKRSLRRALLCLLIVKRWLMHKQNLHVFSPDLGKNGGSWAGFERRKAKYIFLGNGLIDKRECDLIV